MTRLLALLLTLATPLATETAAETIKVKKVDFPLPLGMAENLPADVPQTEVYVTDDSCYYYRRDGAFHFLGCVG
ncbi:hypothetical protein [Sagittula sp. S175]|uniref:hypothetical protein n=1 Tax=Sagittula sp. S175 TaxID=3415129 RepID=UPI003C7ED2C9